MSDVPNRHKTEANVSAGPAVGAPVVEFRNISKHFGSIQALKDVSFAIRAGEVHAVVGENGAGKTTLMNLLGGRFQSDSGEIWLRGRPTRISSPQDALQNGISVVHQEITLCPNLSIAANLALGREQQRMKGIPDRSAMNQQARTVMEQLDLAEDPGAVVGRLPVAQRQLTEIARALVWEAKIIVMDEPNSALSLAETAALFKVVRRLRADGVTIIFISHRIDEVLEIADRITVLRDGQFIGTLDRAEATVQKIVGMMVGRAMSSFFGDPPQPGDRQHAVLEVRHATRAGKFEDVSFAIGRGEILGFAGLQGAGRKPLARCLFGLDSLDGGELLIDGRPVTVKSPTQAIHLGLAFLPEDRRSEGLLRVMTVQDNVASAEMRRHGSARVLPRRWMRELAQRWIAAVDVRCRGPQQRVSQLSGGNQQKVALAKWLATDPRVLILEEPTQGIDVGAKREIYDIMRGLSAKGVGILFISSELPELLALSSRIVVMHCGRLVGEFGHDEATEENVMLAATGAACPA
jgi:ABC-type sugar transport system ATPase subunit